MGVCVVLREAEKLGPKRGRKRKVVVHVEVDVECISSFSISFTVSSVVSGFSFSVSFRLSTEDPVGAVSLTVFRRLHSSSFCFFSAAFSLTLASAASRFRALASAISICFCRISSACVGVAEPEPDFEGLSRDERRTVTGPWWSVYSSDSETGGGGCDGRKRGEAAEVVIAG